MNKSTLTVLFLTLALSARAQWAVTDPLLTANVITMNSNQLAQWATAIKKYEDQILHQIEQIEKAKELLSGQNKLIARVGDWKGVIDRARSIQLRADTLTRDFGMNYRNLAIVDYGSDTLQYTAGGAYVPIPTLTRHGIEVEIDETKLRRFHALEKRVDDVDVTLDEIDQERKRILREIARTAEDIATATSQAETDKFFAKLEALKAALMNVQARSEEKIQRALLQQALNDNQEAKEREAAAASAHKSTIAELEALGKAKIGGTSFR